MNNMTDTERLLEQVREAEERAEQQGLCVISWMDHIARAPQWQRGVELARESALLAAHYALTAMALRDLIEASDFVSVSEYRATPGP
jgi:uncharacterized tellurite resistance protein B-like protein